MKRLLSSCFLLITTCCLLNAQPVCTPDKPVQNLGDIMYRVPHKVTFTLRNTGNKPLLLTSVLPSCGCTRLAYSTEPIPAGKSGVIEATFDAAMMGTFQKDIEVRTNASEQPLYLSLTGRVTDNPMSDVADFPIDLDNVRMNTNIIEFDNVNKGDRPEAEIQIVNTTRMAYQPQLMHLPPFLTATYEPAIVQGGRTGKIRLTLNTDDVPDMGLTQRSIYLARYMGDKVADDNEIAVSVVLLPDFSGMQDVNVDNAPVAKFSEEEIDLGAWGKKQKLTATFQITNRGRSTLEISRLQPFSKALNVSLANSRIAPGATVKLKATVNRNLMSKDKNALRILLITNDPKCPKQTLTIKVQ